MNRSLVLALGALCCTLLAPGRGQAQTEPTQRRGNHNQRRANIPPNPLPLPIAHNVTINITAVYAAKIDPLVEKFMAANPSPGLELSVQKGGQTIYQCGYGTIAQGSTVSPGPDTYFQIDSLTKAFTAFAVMRLVEQGKVDLDKPMSKYLGSLPNKAWKSIPVRQYLGMISGIPDSSTTYGTYTQAIAKAAKKTTIKKKPTYAVGLDFEPGSQYEYSNTNYFILGEMVKAVSGKSFIDYTKDEVLTPLGMSDTGFITYGAGDRWPTPTIGGVPQLPARAPSAGFSGGGFTSTMGDLEKFAKGIYNKNILNSKSYTEMWTRTTFTSGTNKGSQGKFGLGWQITTVDSKGDPVNVNKGGGGWGWGSYLTVFPQTGDTVIVLHNSSGGSGLGQLTVNIENVISGSPSPGSGGRHSKRRPRRGAGG